MYMTAVQCMHEDPIGADGSFTTFNLKNDRFRHTLTVEIENKTSGLTLDVLFSISTQGKSLCDEHDH